MEAESRLMLSEIWPEGSPAEEASGLLVIFKMRKVPPAAMTERMANMITVLVFVFFVLRMLLYSSNRLAQAEHKVKL